MNARATANVGLGTIPALVLSTLAVLAFCASGQTLAADSKQLQPGNAKQPLAPVAVPIELTGEVVDSWCFASQVMGDGRGPKHQSCALACIMGGVTPGIVDDKGQLYLCVKHKAYQGCKELLTPFVAKRVKIKGHLAAKGGVRVLKVTSVQLAR
jgi:hypothetical protein